MKTFVLSALMLGDGIAGGVALVSLSPVFAVTAGLCAAATFWFLMSALIDHLMLDFAVDQAASQASIRWHADYLSGMRPWSEM